MNKTKVTYLCDNNSEYTYQMVLGEHSFISFSNESRLIFKRPLRNSELDVIYRLISQLRLPISKAQDEGLHLVKIKPHVENKLAIQSKTLNVEFLWDNSDEASLPMVYGHLKNLSDYIEAILPLESNGVSRYIPE